MDPVKRLNRSSTKKRPKQWEQVCDPRGITRLLSTDETVSSRGYAFRQFASASHTIFPFRFMGSDGTTNDGSEDDGEHGAGRLLLKALIVKAVENTLVVVSQWYHCKIRPRRFKRIKEEGLSAARNMSGST